MLNIRISFVQVDDFGNFNVGILLYLEKRIEYITFRSRIFIMLHTRVTYTSHYVSHGEWWNLIYGTSTEEEMPRETELKYGNIWITIVFI